MVGLINWSLFHSPEGETNINVNHIGIFLKIIKIYFLASKYVWRSVLMFFLGGIGRDG